MATLNTSPNLPSPDDFYEQLIADPPRPDRRRERAGQRQAGAAAGQPHRRRRRPGAGARRRARGRRAVRPLTPRENRMATTTHARPRDRKPARRSAATDIDRLVYMTRLRQRVRDRGAARRAAGRPQLAAARAVRPVRRAAVGHGVHRAAAREPARVDVPDPAGGDARAVSGWSTTRGSSARSAPCRCRPTSCAGIRCRCRAPPRRSTSSTAWSRWRAAATPPAAPAARSTSTPRTGR